MLIMNIYTHNKKQFQSTFFYYFIYLLIYCFWGKKGKHLFIYLFIIRIRYREFGGRFSLKEAMKRFFKPVEKDGPSKKPCSSSSSSSSPAPAGGVNAEASASKAEPLKFLTWNANSLLLRVKNNWAEFSKFIQTLDPDVIAIQVFAALCCLIVFFFRVSSTVKHWG